MVSRFTKSCSASRNPWCDLYFKTCVNWNQISKVLQHTDYIQLIAVKGNWGTHHYHSCILTVKIACYIWIPQSPICPKPAELHVYYRLTRGHERHTLSKILYSLRSVWHQEPKEQTVVSTEYPLWQSRDQTESKFNSFVSQWRRWMVVEAAYKP